MRAHRPALLLCTSALLLASVGCGGKTDSQAKSNGDDKNGKSVVESHGVKIRTTAAAPTAKRKIDMRFITKDFIAAAVAHPARVLDGELVRRIRAEVEKEVGYARVESEVQQAIKEMHFDPRNIEQVIVLFEPGAATDLPRLFMQDKGRGDFEGKSVPAKEPYHYEKTPARPPGKSRKRFRGEKTESPRSRKTDEKTGGLSGENGTQFVATYQPKFDDGPPRRGGDEDKKPSFPSVIVRFVETPNREGLFEMFDDMFLRGLRDRRRWDIRKGDDPKPPADPKRNPDLFPQKKKHGDTTYTAFGPAAACFVDDKTLLLSNEEMLKKMLDAKDVQSPLTKRLASLGAENDIVIAADVTPIKPLLQFLALGAQEPPELKEAIGYLLNLETIAVTAGISGDTLFSAVLQTSDEKSAAGLVKLFQSQLGKGVAMFRKQVLAKVEKEAPEMKTLITELIDGFAAQAKGKEAIFSLAMPNEFRKLPDRIPALMARAKKAAEKAERRNDLREIGLAFHNYHDTYNHFPAADSGGSRPFNGKVRGKGLSWRVHLLPFVEESNLYQQFKLDEPWDSPHNKTLIAKMPKIYFTPGGKLKHSDGKSRLHVFVGNGAAFNASSAKMPARGPRMADFRDGTSNTLLFVEAGEDKAEIWTRPGGLPFDPAKNPVDLLGNIDGDKFGAAFVDATVIRIGKTIKPTTLKYLIQRNDGNPIPKDAALEELYEGRRRYYGRKTMYKTAPDRYDGPDPKELDPSYGKTLKTRGIEPPRKKR